MGALAQLTVACELSYAGAMRPMPAPGDALGGEPAPDARPGTDGGSRTDLLSDVEADAGAEASTPDTGADTQPQR